MITWLKPTWLSRWINYLLPWTLLGCALAYGFGLYQALVVSPIDYQQGESVRIMYVHVPAAWLSLGAYSFIAAMSLSYLVWRNPLSYVLAKEASVIGACFTAIALMTGSIWGKPMWGTWWVWDARLTSMLILFFFYLSYIALSHTEAAQHKIEKAASILALIGFINIPIIKYSVDFWHSLHQPAGILRLSGSSVHPSMLQPLLIMFLADVLLFASLLMIRTKTVLLSRKLQRIQQESSV